MSHLVLDLVHELVELVLFEDIIVERNLSKNLHRVSVRWHQRRALRASNDEMHLHIFRCAQLDRRKVAKPATRLVLDVVCVRQIEGQRLVDMPAPVLPCVTEFNGVSVPLDAFRLQFDIDALLFQFGLDRAPNVLVASPALRGAIIASDKSVIKLVEGFLRVCLLIFTQN